MNFADDVDSLVAGIRRGSRRAIGRGLTWIESRDSRGDELLSALAEGSESGSESSGGFRLGITGAPGVGKSSLVAQLIGRLRARGERVGVIAVDPTSPISGGALLGDRLRMRGHQEDDGVFIRSLASRSGIGGLAGCTDQAAEYLGVIGFDLVLIETVGVGQLELAIAGEADRVLLLISPEGGDVIQYLKGGLVEVVDRVVVNKSDRPGADETLRVVRQLAHERGENEPIAVSCENGDGLDALVALICEDRDASQDDDQARMQRIERRVRRRAEELWVARAWSRVGDEESIRSIANAMARGESRFADAVDALVRRGEANLADR